MDNNRLYSFIVKAFRSTYATSGVESVQYEKDGFKVLTFNEGNFSYKDSYTGFFRSRGNVVVNYKSQPIWACGYGGGMMEENEDLAFKTFDFLKKAFLTDEKEFQSFRGPHKLVMNEWEYNYMQEGDIQEFSGYEEIFLNKKLVFFHRIIGGFVKQKNDKKTKNKKKEKHPIYYLAIVF